jgi:D-xylose transport system permease protein
MVDTVAAAPETTEPGPRSLKGMVAATEVDLRLFGMVVALVAMMLGFGILTEGKYLAPANLVTLSVQVAAIAIISTGMVLVIVSRNIDLSVGSVVGVVAMSYALFQTGLLPQFLGYEHPLAWIIALVFGLALGAFIGGVQGFIIAYVGVPSFIVTLGGLLILRGFTWVLSSGASVSGLDPTFQLLGGGPTGSIGGTNSWIVGIIGCISIIGLLIYNRRQRRKFGFPLRPMWAEAVIGVAGCGVTLLLVWIANAYLWPEPLAKKFLEARGIPVTPENMRIESGIPWPLIAVLIVTILMTFIATRRRFGRFVFAIGGNPEAAELAGINTRWTIMKTYVLIGLLCGLSAAIAAARLNGSTLDVGVGYELYVIAACVIGGTSFAGGIGTIPGAVLGALVMGALAFGLSFMGLSSPVQNIAAGLVLIVAVGFDTWNRRRTGG